MAVEAGAGAGRLDTSAIAAPTRTNPAAMARTGPLRFDEGAGITGPCSSTTAVPPADFSIVNIAVPPSRKKETEGSAPDTAIRQTTSSECAFLRLWQRKMPTGGACGV